MAQTAQSFSKLGRLTATESNWDIITIGSGHNGLLAAAYMAVAGQKVLVLERASYPGGGVASLHMAEEGYVSERHSAIHQMILGNPLIAKDELGLLSKYGLKYLPLDPCYAIIMQDQVLPLYQDRSRSKASIATFSIEDAQTYDRFMGIAVRIADALLPSMFEPPTDTVLQDCQDKEVLAEIGFASEACSIDVIDKWFTHKSLRVALLRFVTEIQLAHPKTKGTGLMGYLAFGLMEKYGLAVPEGGGTAFTQSVIRCIEAHGGEVRLNTEVTKVVSEDGRAVGVCTRAGEIKAKRAVIGMIHPHLLGQLVDGIDPAITAAAEATRSSEFTLFVIHAALDRPLRFKAGEEANGTVMNTVCPGNMEDLIKSYDDMAEGKIPEKFMIGLSCTSERDSTRAPPGKSLLHCVVMLKSEIAGVGWNNWDSIKDDLCHRVFAYASEYLEDFTPDMIRSYEVVTPPDHVSDTPSFQRGDICGISMAADQMGVNRPTPALAQYRVPGVRGLYLAGPFMHPGGGVWGGGRPVAIRMMQDFGIDFDKVINTGLSSHL
ncbi:FAD dependent [Fusarium globosum]|uniref:Pyridine nucleotide-disulfide oxidoreductase domain-containing protein 2 n=1 Tax=Fusarium globosum TaxID=78864 RepID=A0A8H5YDZ6_9HYPO|nr:FAD dependent [Fusarium globosum]